MISLDTNAVIAAINDGQSPVRGRLEETLARGEAVAVSTVVLFELNYGIAKSLRSEDNRSRLDEFMAGRIEPLLFDPEDAKESGDIRATLERAGRPIGYYDLLIAGQARRRGAVLVTANRREFARVPGLRVEDWTVPL
jgi:tRNA(fMet)-specific endonuclease VapC